MRILSVIILSLFASLSFAQEKPVTTKVDSTDIKIGSQFNLILSVKAKPNAHVGFPELKSIGALEVLESYAVDTIKEDARWEYIKKYGLTQFDSGRYAIPSIPVLIGTNQFLTDSSQIVVHPVVVDTLKQKMFDIKPVVKGESSSWTWLYVLIGLVVLGVLAFFGYKYWKKHRAEKTEEEELFYATPIEKATSMLVKLEKKALLETGTIKEYYTELTDITKAYIEETIHIPAKESTTSELIDSLKMASKAKKLPIKPELFATLEHILKTADLVKFAKSKPMDFEIIEDRRNIEGVLVGLEKSLPVEILEEVKPEELKQKALELQLKQKRKKQKIYGGIAAALLLVIVLGITTDFNLFGDSSKALLKREWISSEYGNPGVKVYTPEVLKRLDVIDLPPDAVALVKEMQTFTYGTYFDDIYISVSTLKYKEQQEINLDNALEASLKYIESKGAQDILVKTEDFQTAEGAQGRKSFGTLNLINSVTKTSKKIYYDMVVFSQEGGLQSIVVFHKEGDTPGREISEKVLNSIEFKKATP